MKNTCDFKVILLIMAVLGVVFTAEATVYPNIVDRWTIYEANSLSDGSGDLEFPAWGKSTDVPGRLMLSFLMGKHPGEEQGMHIVSDDWGVAWHGEGSELGWLTYLEIPGIGPAISLDFNTSMADSRNFTSFTGYRWTDSMLLELKPSTITFPFDMDYAYFHRGLIMFDDGTILASMYVMRTGQTHRECMVVKSTDLGLSWTYLSTAASYQSWMGDEGPSESDMVILRNGNILLVARTGTLNEKNTDPTAVPMIYCISVDHGQSWSAPVSLGQPGVDPALEMLDNGKIVLSYGRPGVNLMFIDETATTWSAPFEIYNGAGCGYTDLAKDQNGDLLVVYSESDFNNRLVSYWVYPGDKNYLKIAKVEVEKPCQGAGYNTADINRDCNVDFVDFSGLADNWMSSN